MIDAVFAVPGDLDAPTGGYAYARRLLAEWPACGLSAVPLPLPGSFPDPSAADLARTKAAFARLPAGAALLVDGLAYGALPEPVIRAAGDRPLVALVHHPLCLETGLSPARAEALRASERAALALAHRVVATSRFTGALLMRDFGVPPDRITVAEPGTMPAGRTPFRQGGPVSLLAVGTVTPRKAHHLLAEALDGLRDLDWHLTIAGALDRAPACAAALRQTVTEQGLGDRIRLAGAVSGEVLDRLYAEADLLVSASLFEGYGMALAEALARGLPVVATSGGAAAETVPVAAGLTVPPGDIASLRAALRRLIADPDARRAAAEASWAAGQLLPRWADTAAAVAACLRGARP
ncbi:glycosyltransferase family 4 protein [Methylobacterium nodulans]|uniref:Glycosyl transferase group 1 n=1 Tax=Methylobacterium nodulans (strain LMG 21967 / CNCM I-2342 / ORS 2060) TaxID=460265 RepID=B8IEF7_METNO|nr:glycosyltransferase family 4 protein [Methylobacterium nodulans]ACL59529.1 glycosyl transferase group 1 [Methylobacterium nodulans ORS 2060]